MKKFSLILIIIFFPILIQAMYVQDFSRNHKIFISDIVFNGNKIMKKKQLIDIMELGLNESFFIYEVEGGLAKLLSSGFYSNMEYKIKSEKKNYTIYITLEENEVLASIKVIDSKFLNLSVFKEQITKNKIKIGNVFSKVALEKAIDDFNIFNQAYGTFLYQVEYRLISKQEIEEANGKFLFSPSEMKAEGIHVIIYIREIPRIFIKEIKMKGTTVAYDEIMHFLKLKEKMWIYKDSELFFRFKRLRRLGFYDSIYFKLIKEPHQKFIYKLHIKTKQLDTSEVTTTLTAPPNIGLITSVEFYDISLFNTLQRFRAGAGWELNLSEPTFLLEYTHPYFWKGIFFDATFSKTDDLDTFESTSNSKLTSNYNIKLTVGANIFGNFFAYLFQNESYLISKTVDDNYEKIANTDEEKNFQHSTGILLLFDNLNDNFFITQGYKLFLEYEVFWKSNIAHKLGVNGEVYIPIPVFNLIAAVNNRSYILFTGSSDTETTLALDKRMRTNVQEITDINNQAIHLTTYTSIELRFPMKWLRKVTKDLSFVVFAEAGGAWANYDSFTMVEVNYGFGLGFRLSPRKHYSSFLFQFPAGLYLGYRAGDKKATPTLISHRDNLYYINLTASF